MKLLSLFLLLVNISLYAQTEKDSLRKSMENASIHDTSRINAGDLLARKYYLRTDPDSAILILNKSISLSTSRKLKKWAIPSYGLKGIAYMLKSDFDEARKNLEECVKLSIEEKDTVNLFKAYANLANIYYQIGDYQLALINYEKVLEYQKDNNMEEDMCKTLNNISNIYSDLELYELAKLNLLKVKELRENSNDTINLASSYINLGNILNLQKKPDSTIYYYKLAESMAKRQNQLNNLALVYNNFGEIEALNKRYQESNYYFNKSLSLRQKIGDRIGVIKTEYSLACNLFEQGRKREAKAIMLPLFNDIQDIGGASLTMSIAHSLYEIFKQEGNYKEALYYYEINNKYRVIVNREELSKKVKQQKIEFQFQLKEEKLLKEQELSNIRAAEELKKKNLQRNIAIAFGLFLSVSIAIYITLRRRIRKQEEKAIKYLLSEFEMKALRGQINSHFIFNALNGINHLIFNKDPQKASAYLHKFANLLRIMIENTRSSWVSLNSELEALQHFIELESIDLESPPEFILETQEIASESKLLIPPMLLQPLVENSFKYGLQRNSNQFKLAIRISKRNNDLLIEIIDNGPQLNDNSSPKIYEGLSLATKIIEERLNILNQQTIGKFHLTREVKKSLFGNCTVAEFNLPVMLEE